MRYLCLATLGLALCSAVNAGPREDWQLVADAIEQSGNAAAAARIRQSVGNLSDEELQQTYANVDLAGLAAQITTKTEVTNRLLSESPRLREVYETTALNIQLKSAGFPDANGYPSTGWCPTSPDRSDASAVQAAQVGADVARGLWEGAKGVWDGASRLCDQTAVIAGAGGNTSTACIPIDVTFAIVQVGIIVAETALEHIAFCDAVIDSAEIEGTYERTGHIHSDLEAHQETLITHDADISQQLDTHDMDIKARLDTIDDKLAVIDGKLDVLTARQLEVIRLLVTPMGRRRTDVPACDGGPCDFPDR